MQPFNKITGKVMPLQQANVDTDQIIPKQFLKSIKRTGFGESLFYGWRYHADGTPNGDFVLNDPRHAGADVLVSLTNFGIGSSREHAVWSIQQYGFRAVISPMFGDIFKSNCYQNGLLPIELAPSEVEHIMLQARELAGGFELTIDLQNQVVRGSDGREFKFQIDAFRKQCLLEGLDDIALTQKYEKEIAKYEKEEVL